MLKLVKMNKDYLTPNYKVEALRNVNVEFRKNEFVSILGPSGCGKTTLLNIIGGLDRYTKGDLFIDKKSTKKFKDSDWDAYRNHSIGFVFQSYNLISHSTVLSNVELALTLSGVSKQERKQRAVKVLEQVGLHDQLYKKPNQLSGGQMQRVAIARALINDPSIILADEPTGALDTETSKQILDILKEVSKDRLVIMVTHNDKLAAEYSNRIIKLLDGEIVGDSNPYNSEFEERKDKGGKKTSMSFFTALFLSFKNLTTKKTRTILTAFGGSIGIIGVALILALSNGFQQYIDKMQADTMSNFPLTIQEEAIDISALNFDRNTELEEYTELEKIFINKITERFKDIQITNKITDEYIENALNTIPKELYHSISYEKPHNINIYKEVTLGNNIKQYEQMRRGSGSGAIWKEIIDNQEFLLSQYDVLKGRFPEDKQELVIVLDRYNRISDSVLMSLGLLNPLDQTRDSFDFDEIIGSEFRWISNDLLYPLKDNPAEDTGPFINGRSNNEDVVNEGIYNQGLKLEIVGIIRPNENTRMGAIESTVGYTSMLTDYVLENSKESNIVNWMTQEENKNINPFSGQLMTDKEHEDHLAALGGIDKITKVNIYPKDFKTKDKIKEHLDNYNENIENEEDRVYYTDYVELLISSMNTAIKSISYVLIAFTSISLVVSSIMIGIITYVSVIERTKEIGILRSLGARKKDISRVFIAESAIIGFSAGLIGVVIGFILTFPINRIINRLVPEIGNIAKANILHALILIAISVLLTLIAGFIPSKIAAKKDPVIALRTE
ncbi:TPA: ATP-binding cassette domain-containing protein [bacterium]|nr:ATP-binding cassette domain-containing protein [bacterium]